ncbi:MBL fold metallo-hydrolase [Comamonas sp. NLF-1-9]|uniref:MBL fold metallo-hydrolase n=1 Tax=Comamonas sp. NLF-1-9 TaxID=2853163 RepID=UPI001C47003A|nr:MBL fold metallo-hydrolase [Comamonas sp. NLF-1-9]QXL85426.1 MBL fold metallo-hydrolase [Comamonas sp. NLF-1-9]
MDIPISCSPVFASFDALLMASAQRGPEGDLQPALPAYDFYPAVTEPASGVSVAAIWTGAIEARASHAFVGGSRNELRQFALCAVLLRHPAGDLLLDAGIGERWQAHARQLLWLQRRSMVVHAGVPAAQQLARSGYDRARLRAILPTHAHWDHISGSEDFAGVPVLMNETERRFIASGHRSTRVARMLAPRPLCIYAFNGPPYMGFEASHDVWGDGCVVLVPAAGHTPGSIIAFVTLSDGQRLAFIGDIVWQMEGLERDVPKPWLSRLLADYAPTELRRLVHRLAALHRACPDIRFIPAHDARALRSLPALDASPPPPLHSEAQRPG